MIRLNVIQGSDDWKEARLGVVTASNLERIITPTGKQSAQWDGYRNQLLAEEITQAPVESDEGSLWTIRGTTDEAKAVAFYELQRDVTIDRVGFVLRDDKRVGCSPDGFVGDKGAVEIKVPKIETHVGYLIDGAGKKYRCQTQGILWIAEREWIDFESFNPYIEPALVRIERDEAFIAEMAKLVEQFLSYVDESRDKLIRKGVIPSPLELVA